ncbi:MAG: dihydrolipoyl dehydrogenase [Eubacteriales bacterium]|nr:dihydrolipoyl dehydrogenase [Eubacteriales bacterium]
MAYDVIVLGGGPAGYLAGERAGQAGLKALVIEKRALGGVCLNEGCIPSKTLLNSAKVLHYAQDGAKFGVTTTGASIDHKVVVARKNKVVNTLVSGVKATLKANKVDVVNAAGFIKGKDAEGFIVEADGKEYKGVNLIIATGSAPAMPPIKGLRENYATGFVMTNREILDLETPPKKLAIIGGGVIGLEMGVYFNAIGTEVTVIEMLDHIAGPTDGEISRMLQKDLSKKGVIFKLQCKVMEVTADGVVYETADGKTEKVEADKVLCSIGRRPVSNEIGIENIGVYAERGAIKTDRFMRTNIPNVYAAGDVNGTSMLAHTAYREAEVAVNNILGKRDIMRYNAIPAVIYTSPEIASVGETEETAKAKGIVYDCAKVPMVYSGRFVAENEGVEGICKVLVEKASRKIIGVQLMGSYASEMIYGAALMVETEMRVNDVKELVFPHPTVSEIIREAIFKL